MNILSQLQSYQVVLDAMFCHVLGQELWEDSFRTIKLPSHDAEVPIEDCLPVYGCPVPYQC